jgi:biopolymer transport protein ExbD
MGMDLDTGGPKKSVRPVMNVAPLVDVVLVLLIIFMVITPLLTKQMTVTVPVKPDDNAEAAPNPLAEPQVVMWVGSDGRARINKDVVTDDQLGTRLQQIFAARRDQTLFYDSHDTVAFGRTVQLIDIARGAGISTIAPLTEPLDDLE